MNKGLTKLALLSLVCSLMPVGLNSCKDYDDDINNLQGQIDAIKIDVDKLTSMVSAGKIITSVKSTSDGVMFTMSDGQTYTITNGKNGENGKPGTSWTIGTDGYWYKDGVKTDYKAIGADGAMGPQGPQGEKGEQGEPGKDGANGADGKDGANGADGKDGANGADGKDGANGVYYVPNPTTGCFDIYQDGKLIEATNISWLAESLTAVYSGNKLTLSNVGSKKETVTIDLGTPIGTIAFIPSVLSNVGGYPTTDKPFYHLNSYISESKYNATTGAFIPQTSFDKSNVVSLAYRVSPQQAYLSDVSNVGFINRNVTTRAAGDFTTLLNQAGYDVDKTNKSGVLTVQATFNKSGLTAGTNPIVAMQVWNGQDVFTSDYIAPSSTGIDAVIVNPSNNNAAYYARQYAITTAKPETSAFIQNIVPLSAAANVTMKYDGTLDLQSALYSTTLNTTLEKAGFTGFSYVYTLPADYENPTDGVKTNQQWFVTLNGSVLSANAANLTTGLTPAIGRTPVVRVDAYAQDNKGTTQMVASAYIKVKIQENSTDQAAIPVNMASANMLYKSLPATFGGTGSLVSQMTYQQVNQEIYGQTGLTSASFWNYYGDYTVKLSVWNNTLGAYKQLGTTLTTAAGQNATFTAEGVEVKVSLGNGAQQTSNIQVFANNQAKTQVTYGGNAAQYKVEINIPSLDKNQKGDIVITDLFTIANDFAGFTLNPNYTQNNINGYPNAVLVKGMVVGGKWMLQTNVEENFVKINNTGIFTYANDAAVLPNNNNQFAMGLANVSTTDNGTWPSPAVTAKQGVAYDNTNHILGLNAPLTTGFKYADMRYSVVFVNNEKLSFDYTVAFQNPFKAGTSNAVTLQCNSNGDENNNVTVATANQVNVVDNNSTAAIYSWSNTANGLVLSSVATGTYKLTSSVVSVKYALVKDAAYNVIANGLHTGGKLEVDAATGVVTYNNGGEVLFGTYSPLTVKATVTFDNLSTVTCNIPVNIASVPKN